MNKYPGKYGKETYKQLEEVCRFGYNFSQVFSDFVETVLSALLSFTDNLRYADVADRIRENRLTGVYEDRYMSLIARYKENKDRAQGSRPADFFTHAWAQLQLETAQTQQDVLGEIYEACMGRPEHGQFFTPPQITDLLAGMIDAKDGETVSDPACGAGRFFIAQSKIHSGLHYVGVDIAPVIARMCVLNMWLFDLYADIYEGNSLSGQMFYLWRVRPGGYIDETKIDQASREKPEVRKEVAEAA